MSFLFESVIGRLSKMKKSPTWLETFLQKPSSAFFVKIDEDFLFDSFNHFGIRDKMTSFRDASKLLFSNQLPSKESEHDNVKKKAAVLYGQIHQRFLSTPEGLEKIYKKYRKNIFPKCPRVYCKNVCCLPYGVSDQLGECKLMFYCPGCNDVYKIQMKEFDKVDKIMPKAMMITAQAIAIKMTRMFKNNDPKLDDFFRKKSRKLKGDDAVLIFSLYAWIKIHQDDAKSALDALNLAMTKCDHPVITANRDRIANGKIKQFSNAQLGDAWYALYLEEPKIKQQRMERRFA